MQAIGSCIFKTNPNEGRLADAFATGDEEGEMNIVENHPTAILRVDIRK